MKNIVGSVSLVAVAATSLIPLGVAATSLPDPEEGVLTLSVPSGTVTYDDAIPPSVTRVVKTGAGEAVLSASSASFDGSADVQMGTLTLKDADYKALGSGRPVNVAGGATLAFKGRTAKAQDEVIYFGTITISGKGVSDLGAIYWAPSDGSAVLSDAAFKSIELAADATIGGTKRYGSRNGTIALNGYTLKLRDADYMFNTTVVKGPGRFEMTGKGKSLYIQSGTVVQNGDYTDTFIRATAGTVYFWNMNKMLDATIEMNGGATGIGAGNYLSGCNQIGAVALIGGDRTMGLTGVEGNPREITIRHDIDLNGYTFSHTEDDVVWHNGSFLHPVTDQGLLKQSGGVLIYTNAATTSQLPQTFVATTSTDGKWRASRIDCRGGNVKTTFLRIGQSQRGVVRTTDGFFDGGDTVYCGQLGGLGAIAVEGGHFRVHGMNLSNNSYGHSIVRQTGGLIDNPGYGSIQVGTGGFAGIFMTGGTNTTRRMLSSEARVQLACLANATARLAIAGKNTFFETEKLQIGAAGGMGAEDILISLNDGGMLSADRIAVAEGMPAGSLYYATFNGGVLSPSFTYAWPGIYYETDAAQAAAFAKQCPARGVVFEKGAIIDMSRVHDDQDKTTDKPCHINFRFDAPEGKTITSITLPESIKDIRYGSPVPIAFESAKGYGANAIAEVDYETGKLTGVTIFSGGCNYDENTKVYVYSHQRSTSGTTKIECAFTLGDPVSGPLVKRGLAAAQLYIENTYTGGTIVEEGRLNLGTAAAFPSNTAVSLGKADQCAKAVLDFSRRSGPAFDVTISKLSGYGAVSNARSVTITEGLELDAEQLFTNNRSFSASEPVVFAANTKITVRDPENLPDISTIKGKVCIFNTEGNGITGSPVLELPTAYAGKWKLQRDSDRIYLVPNRGMLIMVY